MKERQSHGRQKKSPNFNFSPGTTRNHQEPEPSASDQEPVGTFGIHRVEYKKSDSMLIWGLISETGDDSSFCGILGTAGRTAPLERTAIAQVCLLVPSLMTYSGLLKRTGSFRS